jgi:hypothetical protein
MVLKRKPIAIPKHYLFNAAGALLILGTTGYALRTWLFPEPMAACSVRLANALGFSVRRPDGGALTPAELQARLAGRDWGVLENASIVKLKDGPTTHAIKIALPQTGTRPGDTSGPTSGMGFPWPMAKLQMATSACLSYSVFLPDDFPFGTGGSLPGLVGGRMSDRGSAKPADGFSTRYRWREDGTTEIRAASAIAPDAQGHAVDPAGTKLPRGRWVRLEQEVVLNSPGEEDGILRVWIDGELKLERTSMAYRAQASTGFHGVVSDTHYADGNLAWKLAPKSTAIWVTPFEVRWQ